MFVLSCVTLSLLAVSPVCAGCLWMVTLSNGGHGHFDLLWKEFFAVTMHTIPKQLGYVKRKFLASGTVGTFHRLPIRKALADSAAFFDRSAEINSVAQAGRKH